MATFLFCGRFQPFHIGHEMVVRKLIRSCSREDHIVVCVIHAHNQDDFGGSRDLIPGAAEHHCSERNPWPVEVRLRALHALRDALAAEMISRSALSVTAIPRPDSYFENMKRWFPSERVWVIPRAGEDFDERKASFFTEKGERVVRIVDSTKVSGWRLRTAWYDRNREEFDKFVPSTTTAFYWSQ